MVYNEHMWAQIPLIFFFFFVPVSAPLWLASSPLLFLTPHLIIILKQYSYPSLSLWLPCLSTLNSSFCSFPPLPCRSPSHPSVPYHYYEPLGPDECSMYLSHESSRRGSHHRFITEKTVFSNWARTLDIHFYQPDWKPAAIISNMNSSSAPAPAGSWDSPRRRSQKCWIYVLTVSSVQISSMKNVNAWDSSSTEQAAAVAVSLSSLAEWDHCIIASQRLNNDLEV